MPRTVILGSARTPVGKMGGGLASLHPTDLGDLPQGCETKLCAQLHKGASRATVPGNRLGRFGG